MTISKKQIISDEKSQNKKRCWERWGRNTIDLHFMCALVHWFHTLWKKEELCKTTTTWKQRARLIEYWLTKPRLMWSAETLMDLYYDRDGEQHRNCNWRLRETFIAQRFPVGQVVEHDARNAEVKGSISREHMLINAL